EAAGEGFNSFFLGIEESQSRMEITPNPVPLTRPRRGHPLPSGEGTVPNVLLVAIYWINTSSVVATVFAETFTETPRPSYFLMNPAFSYASGRMLSHAKRVYRPGG